MRGPSAATGFAAGAFLLTTTGEQRADSLRPGDQLVTIRADGPAHRPIVRITTRRAAPLLIRAGAFAPDMPARDLMLAAGHNVYADGALFAVADLRDGVSILAAPGLVTFHCIMLDAHDVVLAEGLPVESSPDGADHPPTGNVVPLFPARGPSCLPMIREGRELAELRRVLAFRGGDRRRIR